MHSIAHSDGFQASTSILYTAEKVKSCSVNKEFAVQLPSDSNDHKSNRSPWLHSKWTKISQKIHKESSPVILKQEYKRTEARLTSLSHLSHKAYVISQFFKVYFSPPLMILSSQTCSNLIIYEISILKSTTKFKRFQGRTKTPRGRQTQT